MAGELTATAAAPAPAAGDRSDVPARVLGKLGAATSAAGVCVASAAAAVLAAGDLEEGKCRTFLVVATCVAFHAGLWLLIHAVGGGGGGGAESERSSPASLRGLRRELGASASAAGVCVASAGIATAALLASGDLDGACLALVVVAACVAFHGGIWLLVHGVLGSGGGAESERSLPARLRGLRRELGASASAAGVCVASAGVATAALLASGDLDGACPALVVVAACVAFHGGIWLLVHGVLGSGGGGGGAESERSSPASLRGLRRELGASASAAGVCVASAGIATAALLASGDLDGACPVLVVVAACVTFHGGIWLLVHGVLGSGSGGAESK